MDITTSNQRTIVVNDQDTNLFIWAEAFIVDRQAQNLSKRTIDYYQEKLRGFLDYCEAQQVKQITDITPVVLRQYLLFLEENGHNPGGVHAYYRAVRAYLLWWENEIEPDNWKNPIKKVKAPKVSLPPLEPVEIETVRTLIDTCEKGSFQGDRDKAVLLALLDTGARASEFINMTLSDFNYTTGSILIRQGKGNKSRTVFLGKKSRKAVRAYLKHRHDESQALWIKKDNTPLTYSGLRQIIRRRSDKLGIKAPSLHSFRRAFAINCLRNGMDIFSLQMLMGHADLQILRRYLAQTQHDIQEAHTAGGPVDNCL